MNDNGKKINTIPIKKILSKWKIEYSCLNDYTICEIGLNPRYIQKLHSSNIDLRTFISIDYSDFCARIKSKPHLIYTKISNAISKLRKNDENFLSRISPYCLYEFGISMTILEKVLDSNLTMDELLVMNVTKLQTNIGLGEKKSGELREALNQVFTSVYNEILEVADLIVSLLNKSQVTNKSDLLHKINKNEDMINDALCLLEISKKIRVSENKIDIYQLMLFDYINDIKVEKTRNIIKRRLNGETLEKIGSIYGITRERVRQIIYKKIQNMPPVFEDKYSSIFLEFNFSLNEFCEAFEETKTTYNYLKIKYKKGYTSPTLDDLVKMDYISPNYIKKLTKKNIIYLEGEKLKNNATTIVEYVAKNIMKEYFSMHDLKACLDMLQRNNPEIDSRIRLEETYLANNHHKFNIINAFQRGYKYYPVDKNLILELIDELEFTKYHDVIISTRKLFFENKDYLEEKNITDEYELHNVLKIGLHFKNFCPDIDVSFLRMPKIQFGNANEYELVKSCILAYSPVEADDFYDFMEMEYGYRKNSFISYFGTYFSEYLQNGMINVAAERPPESEYIELQTLLIEEFYFIEDFENILKEREFSLDWLAKNNIKYLGYTKFSTYMIKSIYPSAIDFFKSKLINKNNVFDSSKIDKRFKYLSSFTSYLYDLITNYDYLQIDKNMYINQNRIQEVLGMSKNDLIEYVESIEDMVGNEYFTIDNLISIYGFEDVFREYGLNDYIYTSLFRRNQKIKCLLFQNHWIFKKTEKRITQVSFIEEVVDISNEKNIYEIMDFIEDKYGLRCDLSDIKQLLKESSLYYNDDLEKVYLDYDQYLEEFR
ncbi:sigma factor-like helix-turn-helix DNA-binding protein [Faecalicoccus pleomorphus]|nr:sigma factor-like helix-turn-helix DNA-binding protein [Faecalicoccus pleomorphus]